MATTPYVPRLNLRRWATRSRHPLRARHRAGLWFVAPALLLVMILFVAPTIWTVVISFFHYSLLGAMTPVGIDNYVKAFTDPALYRALAFTTLYTAVVTVVLLLVGFGLALLVSSRRRKVAFFRTVYVIPVVI